MKTLLLSLLIFAVSCSTLRKPASSEDNSLTQQLDTWNQIRWSEQNCSKDLGQVLNSLTDRQLQQSQMNLSEPDWRKLQSSIFQFHTVTSKLDTVDCILKLRKIYSLLRTFQDWTAEKLFEKNMPEAFGENNKQYDIFQFPFRTGDVLLTRGNTFLSSTISQISTNQHHFSHVAYVYVDPSTGKAYTLESYPTKGARVYPMEEALKNENVRILLLRPRDAKKAAAAVNYMYSKITAALNSKKPINYDYLYDENDPTRLSCVEVVQEAYAMTAHEAVPLVKSQIINKNTQVLERVGVKAGNFFVPGDLETDPRFELIFEWNDYRNTADQRIKDRITYKVFQWASDENYTLIPTLKSMATRTILHYRSNPGIWNLLSNSLGMTHVPMEVPGKILSTMVKLNDVGSLLMQVVQNYDDAQMRNSHRHLTELEIEQILERYKTEDREAFLGDQTAPLHSLFRPTSLMASPAH